MTSINALLGGAIGMASLVIALFFLRYWRSSGDRLFLCFALSFLLQAVSRLILEPLSTQTDNQPSHYLLRLLAYAFILVAVIDKTSAVRRFAGPARSSLPLMTYPDGHVEQAPPQCVHPLKCGLIYRSFESSSCWT